MNIEGKEFELKMSHADLWATAFDVKYALQSTLQTHWVNHQDVWRHNEKDRLNRHRDMFYALGRPDLHEDIFFTADEIFTKFNKKQS